MDQLPLTSHAPESPLDEAVRLISITQLELEAKGYPPLVVRAAVMRARGTAEFKTRDISAPIREQAFLDILRAELGRAETWVAQEMGHWTGPDSDKVDME